MSPELINRGISQGAVEPRNDGLVVGRLLGPRDNVCKGVLQDVLRECAISDAALQVV